MPQLPNAKLLQAFEATARHGSITEASKELYVTQSALSRQLQSFEQLLDVNLFIRKKNKIALTDAGHILYAVLNKNLPEIISCITGIQRGGLRRLYIKAPPSFASRWLAPRLQKFHALHNVPITLHIDSIALPPIPQPYDCEIIFGHSNAPFAHAKLLFEEQIQPACAPSVLPLVQAKGVNALPVLHTLSGSTPMPYWDFWMQANPGSQYAPSQASLVSGMAFSTQEQVIGAATEGLGLAIVDTNIASIALKRKELIALAEPVVTPFRYWFVTNRSLSPDTPTRQFCNWLEQEALLCYV